MAKEGRMVCPQLSSVLYLNDDTPEGESRLAATLVMDQVFDAATRGSSPETARRTLLAWPAWRQYLLFDGKLAHGVMNSSSHGLRMTLLINWWDHRPSEIDRVTAEDAAKFGLGGRSELGAAGVGGA
mmetsp:Transcript_5884/g.20042  ORF Transcript_5884/g.20042 Transcript_5884/m.20042 type:complete len:127 (+) Transcript_5884:575-955(+)